ncbi:tetratricopeptide repeat protein [Vallitalea pronyensis]|uniref:Tetratricopeptide repeat protein n=1 Tax=Vallitalea pronyensis TaxID=1348613 RepID=A0A8J8SFS6_9FIRM|nr:tetratricopeptide repeat protein [Vallitalea pronyensis]QUI21538.1 tetratricopeptide repeat protein [Vallitalea pronyensis]
MKFLGKKWKFVAMAYFIVAYIVIMVIMNQPVSSLLLSYAGFILLTNILFLGSSIGVIGLMLQFIVKKDDAAAPFYRIGYQLGSNHINVLTSYGLILLKENQIEKALEVFNKTIDLKPYFLIDKIVKCNIAICYWKLGNVDEAIRVYEKVFEDYALPVDEEEADTDGENALVEVEEDSEKPEYEITTNTYIYAQDYTTLGFLYLLKDNVEKAIMNSKKALILNGKYAPALDNLGQIYYRLEDYSASFDYLKQALEINPKMADSNFYMGLVMEKKGDMEEAKKYYELAASCRVNALNTVTSEEIDRKVKQFRIGM